MNTVELLTELVRRLQEHAALQAWVWETYGKPLSIVLDMDPENPPPPEVYPLAAVLLDEHARQNTVRGQEWHLVLGLCLSDTERVLVAGLEVPAGVLRIERFRELAEEALMAPGIGKVEASGSVEKEAFHPHYAAASAITITNK
jgi:hypothetical protein